jgi:non-ribosomal peptide synthase protein (TIGR01720 family)
MFQHQSVAALAQVAGICVSAPIDSEPLPEPFGLTPIQKWFFSQELIHPHHYNQSVLLEPSEPISPEALEQAAFRLLAHHDALRMRFELVDGEWRQYYGELPETASYSHIDLSGMKPEAAERELEREADRLQRSLDLREGPLMRVASFEMGPEKGQRLLLIVHHLVVDGVSWRILIEDLESCCRQLLNGEAVTLPMKTISMQRWIRALEENVSRETITEWKEYWSERASEVKKAELPRDFAAGENRHGNVRREAVEWSEEETRVLLQKAPRTDGAQLEEVLLMGVVEAVCEWSGQQELLLELEGHGREEVIGELDMSRTVGFFTAVYPIRLKRSSGSEAGARLKEMREQLRRVKSYGIGYGWLRYLSEDEEVRRELERFEGGELIFNYLGRFDQELSRDGGLFKMAGERMGAAQDENEQRSHQLEVTAWVNGGRLSVSWSYSEDVYRAETIKSIVERFEAEVRTVIESHGRKIEGKNGAVGVTIDTDLSPQELDRILARVSID